MRVSLTQIIRNGSLFLVILLLYVIAGKAGLMLAFVNSSTTAVWAPTGISIAAFLLFGYKVWPAIFIGAFLVNITTTPSPEVTFFISLGNTLEGVIGSYLISSFAGGSRFYEKVEQIFEYLPYILFATGISASIGVATLFTAGLAKFTDLSSIWITWWLGDITGAVIVTPFIISLVRGERTDWNWRKMLEAFFFLTLICTLLLIVFGDIFYTRTPNLPLEFILLPLIVLVALRFSPFEVSTTTLLIGVIAIYSTLHGKGPFVRFSPNESLLLLQSFMGVISLSGLCISALITERRKSEELAQTNDERYRILFNLAPDIIYALSEDGKFIDLNPAFEKVTGWKVVEWIGRPFVDIINPEDVPKALEQFKQGLNGQETLDFELRVKTKSGGYLIGAFSSVPRVEKGKIIGKFGVARDVTTRKHSEEILKTNERMLATERDRLDKIITVLADAVVVVDLYGRITLINLAAQRLLSLNASESIGQPITEYLHLFKGEETIPQEQRLITQTLVEGKNINTKLRDDYFYKDRSGRKIPVTINTAPLFSAGKITGAVNIFRDITYEKEIEQLKAELFSITAHHLRTPLTHIRWNIEMLMQKYGNTLSEPVKKSISQVYTDDRTMIATIGTLMKMIRLEQNSLPNNPENVQIPEVIRQVLKNYDDAISLKHIQIDLQLPLQTLPPLFVDHNQFVELIDNLISNAVKYSQQGKITIKVEQQGEKVEISVSDEGIGIPSNEQGKIFSQFFRALNAVSSKIEGNGVGLYLIKKFVSDWGGIIWFESEEGKGTTFHVTIPFRPE